MARERMSNEEATRRRNKRINDYKRDHYDRFNIITPKGTREKWNEYAQSLGISVNQLIRTAVEAYMDENSDNSETTTYTIK